MDMNNFARKARVMAFTTKFVVVVVGVANIVKTGTKVAAASFKAGLEAGKEVADMDAAREKYEAHVQRTAHLHKY